MDGYFSGMTDDFVILVYICCPEVYQDIDDEHNIDYEINDYQRIVVSENILQSTLLLATGHVLTFFFFHSGESA